MSTITFLKKKKVASKVLSFLFLLAPFTSKQKKQQQKKNAKRPTFNWQVFGQY